MKPTFMNRGYTLTEIMVVMIILGVVVSLALPRYATSVERTKAAEGVQILEALHHAQQIYFLEHNHTYATDPAALDIAISLSQNFDAPTVSNPNNGGAIASIQRTNGTYTLTIDTNGTVGCVGSADPCHQAGY